MMNYIWGGMILLSLAFAAATGRLQEVSGAAMSGATDGVTLAISLLGIMCFWSGMMKIASDSGLVKRLGRFMRPLTRFLFPKLPQDSPAMEAIVMNMTANFLGMSNAATPLGLKAMKELHKISSRPSGTASHEMCRFVVLNTASIQLIPTTIIALRQSSDSGNPFEIIAPALMCSIIAVTVGVLMTTVFAGSRK